MDRDSNFKVALWVLSILFLGDIFSTIFIIAMPGKEEVLPPIEVKLDNGEEILLDNLVLEVKGTESNVLLSGLVESNTLGFIGIKGLAIILSIIVLNVAHSTSCDYSKGTVYGATLALCVMYAGILFNNFYVLTQL